jgi:hypothetical protein
MARPWEADPDTGFKQRLGKTPQELGNTTGTPDCPDICRDLTQSLGRNLPDGVSIGSDERLVVIPRNMLIAAKPDIPSV